MQQVAITLPEPLEVFRAQEQQLREYADTVQLHALPLLQACRDGNVLEALKLMGCSHCRMLIHRIVAAVEKGPESFLSSQPRDKEPSMRAAMGAEDAKIQDITNDIAASM
jgi:hypothetical protein